MPLGIGELELDRFLLLRRQCAPKIDRGPRHLVAGARLIFI
jgi:hypothetical protein